MIVEAHEMTTRLVSAAREDMIICTDICEDMRYLNCFADNYLISEWF